MEIEKIEYPLIKSLDTWNYLILNKYYIEKNNLKTFPDLYKNYLNNFNIESSDLEFLAYWALIQKFNMRLKVYKIEEKGKDKYFTTLKLPGFQYKTNGEDINYIENLKKILPEYINIDLYEVINNNNNKLKS